MKNKLLIALLLIVSSSPAQVETYLIDDLNFRTFLLENHPEIVIEDSLLDINSAKQITEMDCSSEQISNLDGLQFFENLNHLNCSYNPITKLLEVPSKLNHLDISHCINLDSIGQLPNTLTYFDCSYNQLKKLPNLPLHLDQLLCSSNVIEYIPYLPKQLTHIDCSFNQLTELPELPNSLDIINCSYNYIRELPDLPPDLGLTYNNPLNIFNNNIECVGEYTEIFDELLSIYPACTDSEDTITQHVYLPKGWSIFSIKGPSLIEDLGEILEPIASDVIMAKDNNGSVYYTEWDYNGVGKTSLGEAYHIKTAKEVSLAIDLKHIKPESNPIELIAGWNLIAYLRNEPASAELVLGELIATNNLLIAKDYTGAVLIPSWDFNGIGNMEAGKGYQIKVQENTLLNFLANESEY